MELTKKTAQTALNVIQLGLIMMWVSHLKDTQSYFSVYALCSILAVICFCDNARHSRRQTTAGTALGITIAALLSLAVTLGNYEIFQRLRNVNDISQGTNLFLNVYETIVTYAGGIVVFYQIFLYLASCFPAVSEESALTSGEHPKLVYLASFVGFLSIYLIYLFFVVYPGSVTSDSMWQILQVHTGNYNNHHPYWHTRLIGLFLNIGYWMFRDSNAAAATFNVFQCLLMAACFAYAVVTLYQYRVPKIWMLLPVLSFAVLPNHITYSSTVWKDVPFGLAVLTLVVAMFRIMRNVGKSRMANFVILFLSGIGTCILRSNGWYAMLAAFVMLILFFRKRCRELLVPWSACLVLGWFLMGPALSAQGVSQVNFIEGLSVPLQQIARVIVNGGELTQEEIQLIDTVIDIEAVPEIYTEECVDPLKDAIKAKNYPFLQEHKGEFLKIWFDIGTRYPWEYVEAWVEETKGYWNGGYDYYIYAQYVSENDFGMYMVVQNNLIHDLVKAYFTLTRETVMFEPFQSVGLHVWILSMLCFLNLLHNRKEFLLTVPVLAVVFTLWLTTPVFCEFRYAYCVFTTIPFLVPVSLHRKETETD